MRKSAVALMVALCLVGVATSWGAKLQNPSFETDLGAVGSQSVWGEYGEIFGEARQVYDGKDNILPAARMGRRAIQIDVPPGTWNGIWQQIPMEEGAAYMMVGYCQIRGGDLPSGCATFLKVEFFDANDQLIDYVEGERLTKDSKNAWVKSVLSGKTPPGTRSVRFVLIAGDNAGNAKVANQIFWDDVDVW
jgi:hypothetical protein